MPGKSSIYQELNGIYDKNSIPNRTAFLYNKMKLFLKSAKAEGFSIVNENILCHLVLDYFADIVRLKQFHGITFTNKEKIVAYTSYWLLRRKPIQFTAPRIDDGFVFVNEAFITSYIADEITDIAKKETVPDTLKEHLFYHLKYRLMDAQSFELIIKSYVDGSK